MRILIIRPGAIGDTLLALPVINALRSRYADAQITFVGNAAVLPLVRASSIAGKVSDFQDVSWGALFSETGINNRGAMNCVPTPFDLAVCWLRDPDGIVERNLCAMGIPQVIVAPGRPPAGERIHIVDYLAGTINRSLSGPSIRPNPRFTLPLPRCSETTGQSARRIVIHPGSGGATKCWPPSSFAAIIQHLYQCGYKVTLLGGPADYERIAAIRSGRNSSCPYTGDLKIVVDAPLIEVAQHIQQSRCYLGNDSGITHLAAMLGVPVVALFGPSDPAVWHPIGPSVKVIHAPDMQGIQEVQVCLMSSLLAPDPRV